MSLLEDLEKSAQRLRRRQDREERIKNRGPGMIVLIGFMQTLFYFVITLGLAALIKFLWSYLW